MTVFYTVQNVLFKVIGFTNIGTRLTNTSDLLKINVFFTINNDLCSYF
ncbi:hypothetical protein JCM19274_3660 [Algibacter lectus]|uniref:Uncharacterized protein n=1 Tax=Algibacter lectus TaxID=221126 RepID=A0A090WSK4_9FLAO|nr:hypothetical protein JCM19274_3660 [Algibacter lectus]